MLNIYTNTLFKVNLKKKLKQIYIYYLCYIIFCYVILYLLFMCKYLNQALKKMIDINHQSKCSEM